MVYINSNSQIRVGVRPWVDSGIDASANLFFSASGLSDTTQRNAVNTLVKDLKRFGLWTKIKAFYPFVGGTAESHKWNLKDPRDSNDAYRLTFSGGWTHSAQGAQCNGTNTTSNTYLSLRSVFGATSYEHNLGVYINYYNPSWSYRNDIGAVDGDYNTNPNISLSYDTNNVYAYNLRGNRTYPDLVFSKSLTPSGLTEFKRFRKGYFCIYKNGQELLEGSTTNTYRSVAYDATFYNPVSSVYIGSGSSWSRYASAYVTEALSTISSYLMYIAIQKFQTSLGRQVGTEIPGVKLISYGTELPSLVTNGLKVNLDASTLVEPVERTLTSTIPGQYFSNNDVWSDTSGQGNNGVFEKTTNDWQNRVGEYWKNDDLGITEIRMRDYNGLVNSTGLKQYQSGPSPDAVYTTYKGTSTSTFTFGGWVKGNSNFASPYFSRGNYTNTTGWGCSLVFGGSIGGKFSVSTINSTNGGTTGTVTPSGQTALSSITIMQPDVWYFVYCVWKPSSYVKIYVNGQLETTTAITHSDLRTHTNNIYGFSMNMVNKDSTWGYGRGIYGAMHVYDRELTDIEIKQNFNSQKSKYNVLSADDSDAQSFVAAASIIDATQITAINTLVTALKTAGIWTKLKAIYPFVGGNANSHKFNLKDPRDTDAAYRLVFNGGWTHTSTGALPNGSNGYANTFFVPSNNFPISQYDAHISLYSRTNIEAPTTNWLSGSIGVDDDYNSAAYFVLNVNSKTTRIVQGRTLGNQWATYSGPLDDSRGFFMINKQSNTSLKLTKNSNLLASNTTLSTAQYRPAQNFYIGAVNGSQSYSGLNYDNKEYSLISIGNGLTDAESAAFYTAVQAFQTSLGRQV
jgi:hypothetical protein